MNINPNDNVRIAILAATYLADIKETLCQVVQLLDGWHSDGTTWSPHDESVRMRVIELQRRAEDGRFVEVDEASYAYTTGLRGARDREMYIGLWAERIITECELLRAAFRQAQAECDTLRTSLTDATQRAVEAGAERDRALAELAAVRVELQKVCDHEWEHVDDSFDHEFGTEQIHSSICEKCGATKPYEPETFGDEAI